MSRREFLNLGKGLAEFLAAKPLVGLRDLLPPEVKDVYTDAEWFTIREPINRGLKILSYRNMVGLSDRIDVASLEPISGQSVDEHRPLRREFPEFDLTGVREGLRLPGHPETAVPDIAGFMLPYLDNDYILPVSTEEVVNDPKTGEWRRVGQLRQLEETLVTFFADAQKLMFGKGILGEAWKLKTVEFHPTHLAAITWAVRRALPAVEVPVRPDDGENLLANVSTAYTGMYLAGIDGKVKRIVTPNQLLFVPIEFSFTGPGPAAPRAPEVQA